jgi:hypothetical protein
VPTVVPDGLFSTIELRVMSVGTSFASPTLIVNDRVNDRAGEPESVARMRTV